MKFLIWLSNECRSLDEVIGSITSQGHEVGVLLIQDAVFLADKGCSHNEEVNSYGVPLYLAKHHAEERGILDRLEGNVKIVDYPEIIDLMMEEYDRVISV